MEQGNFFLDTVRVSTSSSDVSSERKLRQQWFYLSLYKRSPFLKRLMAFRARRQNFKIKICKIVEHKPLNFVSFTNCFIESFSKFLKL